LYYSTLFSLTGIGILGWALMIFLPKWAPTKWVARSAAFPIYLSVLYLAGVVPLIVSTGPGIIMKFGTATGVISLLSDADVALIAWIHILVFDQFVGLLIYRDNMRERLIPVALQSVILFLTLMFGPAGFLLYQLIRVARKHGPFVGDTSEA
jgi:hypothetical protein